MDIRPLNDSFAVAPQITPEELPALRAAGFATVICNRPDEEVPPELGAERMRAAAEAAGLAFIDNPVRMAELDEAVVARQRAGAAAAAPEARTLAYCASGTRSTVVWMLAAAPETDPESLLAAARGAGYALDSLRPQLEALHAGGG
jgi:uncharacterized protein (TIGR01244 family)